MWTQSSLPCQSHFFFLRIWNHHLCTYYRVSGLWMTNLWIILNKIELDDRREHVFYSSPPSSVQRLKIVFVMVFFLRGALSDVLVKAGFSPAQKHASKFKTNELCAYQSEKHTFSVITDGYSKELHSQWVNKYFLFVVSCSNTLSSSSAQERKT